MMIKIGITGGIGSGKSVVSRLLEVLGIPVYIADTESKRLVATNQYIRSELIALLGDEVFKNNELNKPFLASCIFGNPANQAQVNAIIHPRVRDDFNHWVGKHADNNIIAIESAILVEAGFQKDVDIIIMVFAPLNIRMERVVERDSSTPELVQRRIESQMDDEQKIKYAQYIINNDGEEALIPQVILLLEKLKRKTLV